MPFGVKGPCTSYITLEGWGVGSRLRYIPLYWGGGGGWIVRYIMQGNYKRFMVHNAHFIARDSIGMFPIGLQVAKTLG